ncbi:MAG: hypothetical protein A3G33_08095 [Omnitrophica bacterium RIFCSPLOWO2_12_FULL_44_17]|uniref:Peptidase S49 domain-containing protein n=1 Tax=Candidatus Danuiimicrobium aquiferis TaxID=1801832 RepID=A0A1G1KY28_9BACT|nr:MAG: hypothetical protein A3B72_05795 [Omnitrophica bacterium RIFCSPHIGHO2_02_FULL_45_28]OGW92340.1 MAG: hypothetical protein A3E74_09400 [Omnitrophica bacterium RIFCSPHIGHO2_12_FULL_44_12]OGW97763.1 MAG: hypothetical protein A3G33_08095 [Omnitrophica bacterium RIFCSPLOWO2_12_FULL_44_17]OGX04985.1 MAG: hypothetical protein A3J12_02115 [Omnitrophica bacterium RIFCSPLOWO2_02_FULL_44_11]
MMHNNLFFARPWVVKQGLLSVLTDAFSSELTETNNENNLSAGKKASSFGGVKTYDVVGDTALIPIFGVISKRPSIFSFFQFGSSAMEIAASFRAALQDKKIKKIVLLIDSPGGSVDGVAELSDLIYAGRKSKEIIAFSDGQMTSAAYWIGSAASKVYITTSAEAGSIGVYSVTTDWHVANHKAGITREVIKAGRYKAAGHPDKPFSEDDRVQIQAEVQTFYNLFIDAVKRNRNLTDEKAGAVGDGRTYIGKAAVQNGLVDGLSTMEKIAPEMSESLDQETTFAVKTENDVRAHFPGLVVSIEKQAASSLRIDLQNETDQKIKQAVIKERERTMQLFQLAYPGQDVLVKECIKSGISPDLARDQFDAGASLEQKCKRKYATDAKIRQEFSTVESYIGYMKHSVKK